MEPFNRLSDKILDAFEIALEQGDTVIAEDLSGALIMSLTRNAGGKDFTERRTLEDRVLKGMDTLASLKKKNIS